MSRLLSSETTHIPGLRGLPIKSRQVNLLRFLLNPIAYLIDINQRFGLLGAMRKDDPSLVFAFGPDYNQAVLSDPQHYYNFSTLPFKMPDDAAFYRNIDGLVSMNGERHRRYRRLLTPAVSKSHLETYAPNMVRITDTYLQGLRMGTQIDIVAEMKRLSLLIAMNCLFGLETTDSEFQIGSLSTRSQEHMFSPLTLFFPVAIPGTSFSKFMALENALQEQVLQLIWRKRAAAQNSSNALDGQTGSDMLSILMNTRDEDGSTLTDQELQGNVMVLFVAGHETVTYTLTWTLFLLTQHPAVYAAVMDELENVLHGEAPTADQIGQLTVLDSVIKESLRLLPPLPFLLMRQATENVELGSYPIPEGGLVVLSPLITHRLEERFPEPNRFLPERWLTIKPTAFEYLPFGAGPRMCLGVGFAAQELRIVLAMLLQRFRLEHQPQGPINYQMRSLILGPQGKMMMNLAPPDQPFKAAAPIKGNIHRLVTFGP
jgi:cytochrome P450